MKTLKAKETGNKSTVANVESKIVACNHTSVHPSLSKGSRFQLLWNISLANLTDKEILEAAGEHFLIKIRRDFVDAGVTRKDGKITKAEAPKSSEWNGVEIDAKKYVTKRETKAEKVAKALAGFSDEELAAMGLARVKEEDSTEEKPETA